VFEALIKGSTKLVQYSLIGSVFSNLLLVLGCSLIAGGNNSHFELSGISANAILLMIGSVAIATPQMMDMPNNDLVISRISAIVLFCAYGQLLGWLWQNSNPNEETEQYKLKPWCSALCLAIFTGITAGVGEILVGSIETASEQIGFTYKFTMLIILPFLGNGVEHYAAVVFAWNKKMDLAINTCVSSSTQICLFLMPLCVLLGWCMDVEMHMGFQDKFVPVMFCLSTIITFAIISDGVSHWLEGSMLLTLYFLFGAILCYDKTM
jgi:calcium/proton exchanger cax